MAKKTTESKTESFVKQVAAKDNVKAQQTLESIVKAKVEQRVKDVLASLKED